MRIKEIQVKGLFGMFDHTIPLNLDEHLTIIYGINGIGKTMLFKILDSFFNFDFYKFIVSPIKEMIITLEDNNYIKFINSEDFFDILYVENNETNIEVKIDNKKLVFPSYINSTIQKIDLIEKSTNDLSDSEKYNLKVLKLALFPNNQNNELFINKYKDDISNINSKTKVYFIETQRLLQFNEKNEKIETIKKYSNDLAQLIQDKHREYAKKSEEFEISLSKRLVNQEIEVFSDINELKTENNLLEEERERLKSVGLFENIKYEKVTLPNDINEVSKAVLSVNIQDMKKS